LQKPANMQDKLSKVFSTKKSFTNISEGFTGGKTRKFLLRKAQVI